MSKGKAGKGTTVAVVAVLSFSFLFLLWSASSAHALVLTRAHTVTPELPAPRPLMDLVVAATPTFTFVSSLASTPRLSAEWLAVGRLREEVVAQEHPGAEILAQTQVLPGSGRGSESDPSSLPGAELESRWVPGLWTMLDRHTMRLVAESTDPGTLYVLWKFRALTIKNARHLVGAVVTPRMLGVGWVVNVGDEFFVGAGVAAKTETLFLDKTGESDKNGSGSRSGSGLEWGPTVTLSLRTGKDN